MWERGLRKRSPWCVVSPAWLHVGTGTGLPLATISSGGLSRWKVNWVDPRQACCSLSFCRDWPVAVAVLGEAGGSSQQSLSTLAFLLPFRLNHELPRLPPAHRRLSPSCTR